MITAPKHIRFCCGKEAKFIGFGTDTVTRTVKGRSIEKEVENKDKLVYIYTLDGQKHAPSKIGKEVIVTLKYLKSLYEVHLLTVIE